ncbi:hypothetical protein F9L07_27135 [Pimelobacter simplex]|uniref:Membrane-bound lytic murein transglycosylase B n=1 Tax=Nocardioides simplex TaxID=2045 RepID=A0A7J5DR01_NOCSI|nr:hypothetical protein [Pimelobacter simplex]KAB2807170.1 hypothetical protein F9L07_27135 [Pimelobacter simplex]
MGRAAAVVRRLADAGRRGVRRRSSRTRQVTVVLLGVLLATTGVVGGVVQVLRASSAEVPTTTAVHTESTEEGVTEAPVVAPAVMTAPDDVRRAPVARPSDLPGSLGSAPPAAVLAYQRAATIMDTASRCGLPWTVLAAVGRVESDHGRGPKGDHRVGRAGRVKPGYVAASLDGRGGRGELPDTDLGALDGDPRWDAPVGPLGLLPATWSRVAVDADNNGVRDPQDLDDAALAAAVLLCADQDLGTRRGLKASLAAFHPGDGFVPAVLAIARRYEKQAAQVPAPPPVTLPLPVLPGQPGAAVTVPARVGLVAASEGPRATLAPTPSLSTPPRPTGSPTGSPTDGTSPSPTGTPSETPTETPSETPTESPTGSPGETPTDALGSDPEASP